MIGFYGDKSRKGRVVYYKILETQQEKVYGKIRKTRTGQARSDPFCGLLSELPVAGINFALNGDSKSLCSNPESLLTGQ